MPRIPSAPQGGTPLQDLRAWSPRAASAAAQPTETGLLRASEVVARAEPAPPVPLTSRAMRPADVPGLPASRVLEAAKIRAWYIRWSSADRAAVESSCSGSPAELVRKLTEATDTLDRWARDGSRQGHTAESTGLAQETAALQALLNRRLVAGTQPLHALGFKQLCELGGLVAKLECQDAATAITTEMQGIAQRYCGAMALVRDNRLRELEEPQLCDAVALDIERAGMGQVPQRDLEREILRRNAPWLQRTLEDLCVAAESASAQMLHYGLNDWTAAAADKAKLVRAFLAKCVDLQWSPPPLLHAMLPRLNAAFTRLIPELSELNSQQLAALRSAADAFGFSAAHAALAAEEGRVLSAATANGVLIATLGLRGMGDAQLREAEELCWRTRDSALRAEIELEFMQRPAHFLGALRTSILAVDSLPDGADFDPPQLVDVVSQAAQRFDSYQGACRHYQVQPDPSLEQILASLRGGLGKFFRSLPGHTQLLRQLNEDQLAAVDTAVRQLGFESYSEAVSAEATRLAARIQAGTWLSGRVGVANLEQAALLELRDNAARLSAPPSWLRQMAADVAAEIERRERVPEEKLSVAASRRD